LQGKIIAVADVEIDGNTCLTSETQTWFHPVIVVEEIQLC
jgi:hypothetical protein